MCPDTKKITVTKGIPDKYWSIALHATYGSLGVGPVN